MRIENGPRSSHTYLEEDSPLAPSPAMQAWLCYEKMSEKDWDGTSRDGARSDGEVHETSTLMHETLVG